MLTALDAEIVRELLVSRTWQSLGEQVGQHRRSAAVLDFDFTGLYFVTDVMVLDVCDGASAPLPSVHVGLTRKRKERAVGLRACGYFQLCLYF